MVLLKSLWKSKVAVVVEVEMRQQPTVVSVELVEVGVDGAEIEVGTHSILPETLVWLAVERKCGGAKRTLVFPARVVWAWGGSIGVRFSGVPGWSQRGARRRDPLDESTLQQSHGGSRGAAAAHLRVIDDGEGHLAQAFDHGERVGNRG